MNSPIEMEKITLHHLLTADTHGQIINIKDQNASKSYELIPNRQVFFSNYGPFAPVEDKGIIIIKNNGKEKTNINDLLDLLDKKQESCVVLIEGFAGCGKSTLVQYILKEQLQTTNFDYNFYNYDLEAQNDILIHDENGQVIKKSSIFEAIKKSFFEQYVKVAKENKHIIDDFNELLLLCKNYQPFNDLYYSFYNTDTYDDIKKYIKIGIDKNERIIKRNLLKQSNRISSSTCILALDYILRLSMFKNKIINKLYICYDNLDAIEDASDLKIFDDNLATFRRFLDGFIVYICNTSLFEDSIMPHFIIMATYRKITASLADIESTVYKEVEIDKSTGNKNNLLHIDATSAFSYSSIVRKRNKYFKSYFENLNNISDKAKYALMDSFDSWDKLNQNLEIMNDRYACLWNKNYRTCSLIANELYTDKFYDFSKSVDFIKNSNGHDGYDTSKDDEGNNVLCTYYGSSAIILSNVCKVFHTNHIWDDFLDLAPLNKEGNSYKYVSFSRIILTYIYNIYKMQKRAVSLQELYELFCDNNLFDYKNMCLILSKMLARNLDGVWRRPIYYASECIMSEKAKDIETVLINECKEIKENGASSKNYTFLLCDSGRAYVDRLMQEFEFFSNRLSNNNKSLYLYDDINTIEKIIEGVYNSVLNCCKNMLLFRKKYIELTGVSDNGYLNSYIHPRTNFTHSPQLHTERTIFSHIAYLNNVRRYFTSVEINPDFEKRKKYNKVFVEFIQKYLELYYTHIIPLSSQRKLVADKLKKKTDLIIDTINSGINDKELLFMSISIKP